MKSFVMATIALLLVSCAATPMSADQSQSRLVVQKQEIGLDRRCCMEAQNMPQIPWNGTFIDQAFDASSPVIPLDGRPTTANIYRLRPAYAGKQIEFFSYSDKKRSVFHFDSVMFIAPEFVFLDSNFRPMQLPDRPTVCWGGKSGKGGLWARTEIPTNANYLLVAARNDKNIYAIDTRQAGAVGMASSADALAIEAIAEARQSYVTQVGTGYSGLYSLDLVEQSSPRLGRCFLPPQ